jgi:hypothetical protein
MRTLLIFAGASKTGKTTLARRLAIERSIPYSSFSATVRRLASERYPNEKQTIELLQNLGHEMVEKDPFGFCREVCGPALRNENTCHILDGLRHRRLVPILKALHPGYDVRIIYTEASKRARLGRFEPSVSEAELESIDSHVVEGELDDLKEVADITLSTDSKEQESYFQLVSWLTQYGFGGKEISADQGINISRGFWHLWIVFSLVWVLVVLAVSLMPSGMRDIIARKQEQQASDLFASRHVIPLSCGNIRGVRSQDYFEFRGRCWMLLDRYRALYPEDKVEADRDLANRTYAAIGQDLVIVTGLQKLSRILLVVALGPLLTLGLGFAVYFVGRGFNQSSTSAHE